VLSLSAATAGNGVLASRAQLVANARARRPNSLAQQHLGGAKAHPTKAVLDPSGIGADVVIAQEHDNGAEPAVY
jgi:hypothetical protein